MGKKLFFVLFATLAFLGAQAQYDTIGKYPYLYHYNWPETGIMHDSQFCGIGIGVSGWILYGNIEYFDTFLNGELPEVFASYQHIDTPLEIIGLATGWGTGSNLFTTKTALYDSSMNELSAVHGLYYTQTWQTDTDAHHFLFPGLLGRAVFDNGGNILYYRDSNIVNTPVNYVYFKFFKEPITVIGDFYIGFSTDSISPGVIPLEGAFMGEIHNEPYSFNSGYRIQLTDGRWSDMCWRRYVPVLFAIINPPCDPVDSVTVTVGTDGCLQADWQRPALQSSWIVRLVMPDGGEVMQPTDTNHWEYCGLAPNQNYTVYVRSRCDNLNNDYSWSDWSDGISYVAPQAIDDIDAQAIKVTPNPTRGMVHIEAEGVRAVWLVAADGRRTQLQCKDGTVSLKAFAPGLYVLEVQTADGFYKAKVVRE